MLDMWNEIILPYVPPTKVNICLFICIYLFQQHAHIFPGHFQFCWLSACFCPKTFKSCQFKPQFRNITSSFKNVSSSNSKPIPHQIVMVDPSYNLQNSVNKSQRSPIFHVKCASLVNMTFFSFRRSRLPTSRYVHTWPYVLQSSGTLHFRLLTYDINHC